MIIKTKHLLILMIGLISGYSAAAQITQSELKQQKSMLEQKIQKMSEDEIRDYYHKMHTQKPARLDFSKIKKEYIAENPINKSKNFKAEELPSDMIFPIESDEVQAVLIEWPHFGEINYNGQTYQVEQTFEGYYMNQDYFGNVEFIPCITAPDVSLSSPYAKVHAELADAIQKHTQVWIVVFNADDTTSVKSFMEKRGTPLVNYRFFTYPGNSFWARDWGPVAFYYGDNDSIAFADFEYYGGRPLDDALPVKIASELGWKCFTNTIEYEGGNILVDGLGSLFTTSAVYSTNKDSYGLAWIDTTGENIKGGYYSKEPLSEAAVRDSIKRIMNLNNITVVPALTYDGGTGHIDLYADMWEETGFVAAKYPSALSSWADTKRLENNIDTFTSRTNYFGNKYDATRVPLPAKDNGSWYSNGRDYNNYTRCWANHIFVNDAIIQPVFYDTTLAASRQGDVEGNKKALEVLKQCYPGYTFEEIDVRSYDGSGGAIHCITKQIPAENPVRIYHQPARWFNTSNNGNKYNVEVLSQNQSGIDNVKIFYKTVKENSFNELVLTYSGDNLFKGEIILDENVLIDTLQYYISSTSNNGKTINKPMTAHNGGFYVMPYGKDVNTYNNDFAYDDEDNVGLYTSDTKEMESISEIYPNPAINEASVTLNNTSDLYYRIINLIGQVVTYGKINKNIGSFKFQTKDMKAGNYWIIFTDGNISTSRKLVIAK